MYIRLHSPLLKKAYGYDISGEVQTDSGSNSSQQNIEDVSGSPQPQGGHTSPKNPANFMHDDATEEFPELNRPSKIRFLPSRGLR